MFFHIQGELCRGPSSDPTSEFILLASIYNPSVMTSEVYDRTLMTQNKTNHISKRNKCIDYRYLTYANSLWDTEAYKVQLMLDLGRMDIDELSQVTRD